MRLDWELHKDQDAKTPAKLEFEEDNPFYDNDATLTDWDGGLEREGR